MTDASPAPSATDDADGDASGPASSPGPRPGRPRPGTAERREEILRAATRVFGSRS